MRQRTPSERFRREYLAEFVEDELAYFTQKLIAQCIASELAPITDDWTKHMVPLELRMVCERLTPATWA
jgi:hypothetical protein